MKKLLSYVKTYFARSRSEEAFVPSLTWQDLSVMEQINALSKQQSLIARRLSMRQRGSLGHKLLSRQLMSIRKKKSLLLAVIAPPGGVLWIGPKNAKIAVPAKSY